MMSTHHERDTVELRKDTAPDESSRGFACLMISCLCCFGSCAVGLILAMREFFLASLSVMNYHRIIVYEYALFFLRSFVNQRISADALPTFDFRYAVAAIALLVVGFKFQDDVCTDNGYTQIQLAKVRRQVSRVFQQTDCAVWPTFFNGRTAICSPCRCSGHSFRAFLC